MKRAVAFILSLTVIWLQMLASAQTLSPAAAPPPECRCCTGKKVCCCIAAAAPETIPVPVAPVSGNPTIDFHAILGRIIAWTLPAAAPTIISSFDSASELLPAVPLFQRNCALLI